MLTAFLPLLFSASATQISILRMRVEPSSTIWVDTTKEHMIWPWHLNQETQKSVRKAEVTLVSETTKPQTGMVFYPSTLDVLYNDKYEWVDTTKIFWCKFNYEELVGAGTKSKEEVRAGVLFFTQILSHVLNMHDVHPTYASWVMLQPWIGQLMKKLDGWRSVSLTQVDKLIPLSSLNERQKRFKQTPWLSHSNSCLLTRRVNNYSDCAASQEHAQLQPCVFLQLSLKHAQLDHPSAPCSSLR